MKLTIADAFYDRHQGAMTLKGTVDTAKNIAVHIATGNLRLGTAAVFTLSDESSIWCYENYNANDIDPEDVRVIVVNGDDLQEKKVNFSHNTFYHLKQVNNAASENVLMRLKECIDAAGKSPVNPVLLYSESLSGHRHLYVHRLAEVLSLMGYPVVVASRGFLDTYTHVSRSVTYSWANESQTMKAVRDIPGALVVDIDPVFSTCGLNLAAVVGLQTLLSPCLTILIDGDHMADDLLLQGMGGMPELRPVTAGIFIHWDFLYTANGAFPNNFHPILGYREPLRRPGVTLEEYFYLSHLPAGRAVDWALVSDENAMDILQSPHFLHVPEVGAKSIEPAESASNAYYAERRKRVDAFLEQTADLELLLFYGDLENRKGFGDLLGVAMEQRDTAVLRLGRTKPGFSPSWDIVYRREALQKEGRYFEVEGYVEDSRLVDTIFHAIRFLILPYEDFYRTSAVMMQALGYGKPVIAPQAGLIGDRILRHGLGLTYQPGDKEGLTRAAILMRNNPDRFAPTITAYMDQLSSRSSLERALRTILQETTPQEPPACQGLGFKCEGKQP